MKKVINNRKEISIDEVVNSLQNGEHVVVFYTSRSTSGNEPYPAFFKKFSQCSYGFVSPIYSYASTFCGNTIRESLGLALAGGKSLFTLERNEVNQIFKKQQE